MTHRPRRTELLWAALIVVVYAGVRLLHLDQLVTTDEPLWLGRSANFYRALVTGELEHTYQMAHPGVLTMWAGALAYAVTVPDYATMVLANIERPMAIDTVLRSIDVDPLALLVTAKVIKVGVQTLFFGCALWFCSRLLNVWVAGAAGLLIALDPFLSGLDSALHVDGLFAILSLAAVLSIVYAAERTSLRDGTMTAALPWAVAGVLCACAWLTRATGVVLVGVVAITLVLPVITGIRRRDADPSVLLMAASKYGWVWLAAATATTFVLLPALWINPVDVLFAFVSWNVQAAVEGHENPTNFNGEIHTGDPGWRFYPLSMVWRTTPVTWLGLALLVTLGAWSRRHGHLPRSTVRIIATTGVFAVAYIALMTIGAKKFDRYILSVYPILAIYAAIGFGLALLWVRTYLPTTRRSMAPVLLAGLVVAQGIAVASVIPYRLDYFNPTLGGTVRAERMWQLGWGHGGREVVDFILDRVDPDRPTRVAVSAVPQAFVYFLPDDANIIIEDREPSPSEDWDGTDWYVAGIQQTQRDQAPTYHWLMQFEPAHVVAVEGVPYFEVYDLSAIPTPEVPASTEP